MLCPTKNPISAENLTGAARLLRSYAQAAMENIALWHERDISHSSVESCYFSRCLYFGPLHGCPIDRRDARASS